MVDLTRDFETTSETVQSIISKVDFTSQKLVFLLNKTDIVDVNKNVNIVNYIVSELDKEKVSAKLISYECGACDNNVIIIPISAKTGSGIAELRSHLAPSQRNMMGDSDTTLVTNQRHIQALTNSRTSLLRVREGLAAGLPTDLASQDIREAIYHLGSIVGEISTDEVLGNIFANFCIGK